MVNKNTGADKEAIFMNSTLVTKIAKNRLEEIHICILKNNKVDVRTYFYFPQEPDPKPTRKGIWLSFKHIPVILGTLDKIVKNPKADIDVEVERTEKEQIRVYANEYMGNRLAHIRTFYFKDNEFKPGKGVSFSVTLAQQILEGLRKADDMKDQDLKPNQNPAV